MKNIIFLLSIFLFSCNSKTEKKPENSENINSEYEINEQNITGKKYFEYDEIEHYKIDIKIENGQIGELINNQKKTLNDSIKKELILGGFPYSISDLKFNKNLEYFGFEKRKVDSTNFKKINKIFIEKKHSEAYLTDCIPIYRDILIFKKKSKVTGIAKICFDCDANIIVGTESNTEEFGMNGDYEKLKKILHEK